MLNNVEGCFGDISDALEAYKTTLDSGTDDIKATKDYVAGIQKDIRKLSKSLKALSGNDQYNEMIEVLKTDPQMIAQFVASPVAMETEAIYPIRTYGSAMAPFYTVLAIWVGALILVALIHVEVRREDDLKRGSFPACILWKIYYIFSDRTDSGSDYRTGGFVLY